MGGCVRLPIVLDADRLAAKLARCQLKSNRAAPSSILNLPGPELAAIEGSGLGFYSFRYRYIYGEDGAVRIARMEQLRDQLPQLVAGSGEAISEAAASHLEAAPAINTSQHRPYAHYYSAELRDLVANAMPS